MSKLEHLGTIQEIRKEFDKTIAMGCREDRWYLLMGGSKDITNRDIEQAFAMFCKLTINEMEKGGADPELLLDNYIDFLEQYRDAIRE